jgi:hypothetical protein
MQRNAVLAVLAFLALTGCNTENKPQYVIAGEQSKIVKELIDAVNEKDAHKYVAGFDDSVQVFVEAQLKVNGKEALIKNRAKHFENHPHVRSEIQHLVEIDNKVILHDKVWLDKDDKDGQNIVEIFTFTNGKVIKVEVIQPNDLFRN